MSLASFACTGCGASLNQGMVRCNRCGAIQPVHRDTVPELDVLLGEASAIEHTPSESVLDPGELLDADLLDAEDVHGDDDADFVLRPDSLPPGSGSSHRKTSGPSTIVRNRSQLTGSSAGSPHGTTPPVRPVTLGSDAVPLPEIPCPKCGALIRAGMVRCFECKYMRGTSPTPAPTTPPGPAASPPRDPGDSHILTNSHIHRTSTSPTGSSLGSASSGSATSTPLPGHSSVLSASGKSSVIGRNRGTTGSSSTIETGVLGKGRGTSSTTESRLPITTSSTTTTTTSTTTMTTADGSLAAPSPHASVAAEPGSTETDAASTATVPLHDIPTEPAAEHGTPLAPSAQPSIQPGVPKPPRKSLAQQWEAFLWMCERKYGLSPKKALLLAVLGVVSGSYGLWQLWQQQTPVAQEAPDHATVALGPEDIVIKGTAGEYVEAFHLKQSKPYQRYQVPRGCGNVVAIERDGKFVAAAGRDYVLRLWVGHTGLPAGNFQEHKAPIRAIAFSDDAKQVVSAGDDGLLITWNIATIKSTHKTRWDPSASESVAFSRGGKYLAVGTRNGQVRILETASGSAYSLNTGRSVPVTSVVFDASTEHVVSCTAQGQVQIWDLKKHAEEFQFSLKGAVRACLSPNGKHLAYAQKDGKVWVRELTEKKPRPLLSTMYEVLSLEYSANGKFLVAGGSGIAESAIWDAKTGEIVRVFKQQAPTPPKPDAPP